MTDAFDFLQTTTTTNNNTDAAATPLRYSNPRMHAEIPNWPHGGKRVTAVFDIETHPTRGQRAVRVTTGQAKKLTYARQMRIVDGADGKTYVAELASHDLITIRCGDMKYRKEDVWSDNPRHAELLRLFGTVDVNAPKPGVAAHHSILD